MSTFSSVDCDAFCDDWDAPGNRNNRCQFDVAYSLVEQGIRLSYSQVEKWDGVPGSFLDKTCLIPLEDVYKLINSLNGAAEKLRNLNKRG